jgi:DNA-binding CsgD family transcriptional regulator
VQNFVLLSRGMLRLSQRRAGEAVADLEELLWRERVWRAENPAMMPIRSGLAVALLATGERERARRLASDELELARRFGARRAIGIALRALGLTEGGRRGIELLEEGTRILAASGAVLEHTRALLDLGAALRRSGAPRAAQQPLRLALDGAAACGATALVGRAQSELAAAGARPRRHRLHGVDALTAMERRVATMAADGMTNREIAQALFVTGRTVETHLTHAFQKLGVPSRRELARALSSKG